ncbi:MAG: Fic family protein [Candidatus Diapherotrites archaeon]
MAKFPSVEKVIEFNILALNIISVKKADSAKVLSKTKISEVLKECKGDRGDIYDKAVVLLKGIIQKYPFASGNRRTAFVTMKYFLGINRYKTRIKDDPKNARPFQGIRESYYLDEEIKEWIKNGKIREFKR